MKGRRYGSDGAGARAAEPAGTASVSYALRASLSVFQRLFAPFLPFVAEEVWSWWQPGSVHLARWPDAGELLAGASEAASAAAQNGSASHGEDGRADLALTVTVEVLGAVRKAKSDARQPMRAPVARVIVRDTAERLHALELGCADLRQAGSIQQLEPVESDGFAVEVELAGEPGA